MMREVDRPLVVAASSTVRTSYVVAWWWRSPSFGSAPDFFEHLSDCEVPHRCWNCIYDAGLLLGHIVGGDENLLDVDVERRGRSADDAMRWSPNDRHPLRSTDGYTSRAWAASLTLVYPRSSICACTMNRTDSYRTSFQVLDVEPNRVIGPDSAISARCVDRQGLLRKIAIALIGALVSSARLLRFSSAKKCVDV